MSDKRKRESCLESEENKRTMTKSLTKSCCLRVAAHTSAFLIILVLSHEAQVAQCVEAKEFDWSDLGVSLANARSGSSAGANGSSLAANNLRILVSPQRRLTKNYEFEYSNNTGSQTATGDQATSYMVAGSSPYLGQSVYQLSPNASHSSAYSALSASLASLKNRLSARGMTLASLNANGDASGSSAGQSGSSASPGQLYASAPSAYGSPSTVLTIDPTSQHQVQQQQAQQQQAQQQQAQAVVQTQSQQSQPTTYLSVSTGSGHAQELIQPSAGLYSPGSGLAHHHHSQHSGADTNKTIVLAIPAKINFLTGSKSSSVSTQQVQQAGVAVEQQPRTIEYAPKQQMGLINTHDGSPIDASQLSGAGGDQQEHQQYVIVSSSGGSQSPTMSSDHHSVAATLSASPVAQSGPLYSTAIYQPQAAVGSYAMKYIPTASYGQPQQQPQQQTQQAAVIQKVYSVLASAEQPQAVAPTTIYTSSDSQQQQPATSFEQQYVVEQHVPAPMQPVQMQPIQMQAPETAPQTTSRCPDTCNSADPRWRKYTISKYRSCCYRSSQYDATLGGGQNDSSQGGGDDAYYSYLYRRSRSKRQRRQRNQQRPRMSYQASQPSQPSSADAEPEQQSQQGTSNEQTNQPGDSSSRVTGPVGSSYSSSRGREVEYPYMKYYKNRYSTSSQSSDPGADSGVSEPSGRAIDEQSTPTISTTSKSRSYRRGRSRDYYAQQQQQQQQQHSQYQPPQDQSASNEPSAPSSPNETSEEEQVYPRAPDSMRALAPMQGSSNGYGNGEFSVDTSGGRSGYGAASQVEPDDSGYDEQAQSNGDQDGKTAMVESSPDYPGAELESNSDSDASDHSTMDQTYPSITAAGSGKYTPRRRRPSSSGGSVKSRSRKTKSNESGKSKKGRKSRKYSKIQSEHLLNANGTDYESAQASGEYTANDEQSSSNESSDNGQDNQSSGYSGKSQDQSKNQYESNNSEHSAEKDSVLAKYKSSMNESSAVANLSKTTMHLKEILSLLERKAQLKANESVSYSGNNTNSQYGMQPITSTSSPITTTTISPYQSLLSASSHNGLSSSALPGDFLATDFGLRSPYRFDPSSLASSLSGPPMSLPASFGSAFGGAPESLSSLSSFHHYPGSLHPHKSLASSHGLGGALSGYGGAGGLGGHSGHGHGPHGSPNRKRRPNKNHSNSMRYNDLLFGPKGPNMAATQSLLHAAAKNRLLNPALYSPALNYPYLYRGNSHSITNSYPYKSLHKNPYSSLLAGSMTSKLAAAAAAANSASGANGGLYSDDSRFQDPMANVASSLRPSSVAGMRLRSKSPFVFQPQVLPIYTRHTILSSQLDAKAAAKA